MLFLSCYDLLKDTCDGRCQGCSYCPICDAYHKSNPVESVTRWDMIKYAISSEIERWKMAIWFKIHRKKIKEIIRGNLHEKT